MSTPLRELVRRDQVTGQFTRGDAVERFWAKVRKTDGCWEWLGAISKGYGRFWTGTAMRVAHRFAYQLCIGEVPKGLELDHLCRNRACVNPVHLEPVTLRVNNLRGIGPTAVNARKTHCIRGHELVGANLYRVPNGRACRTCMAERDRRRTRRFLEEELGVGG